MVKFRMNHGRQGKGRLSGRGSNMRYIVILVALFALFVWLMTVNLEPMLESLLAIPQENAEENCYAESDELRQINDLILAPWKGEEGLLWISHSSDALTNYGFRSPSSDDPFRMPLGLTEFWEENEPALQFSKMDIGAFRILEEAYCQIYDWTKEYGSMYVVSGMIQCSDTTSLLEPGKYVFLCLLDSGSDTPRSISFLWENEVSDQPLNEMVFSLKKINSITGLEIFEDLKRKFEVDEFDEVNQILSLGYHTQYYEQRLAISDQ